MNLEFNYKRICCINYDSCCIARYTSACKLLPLPGTPPTTVTLIVANVDVAINIVEVVVNYSYVLDLSQPVDRMC